MKKIFLIMFSFFLFAMNINADTVKVKIDYNNVNLRKGPGTNYGSIKTLGIYSSFVLADSNIYENEKGCDDGWYKIYYSGQETGYVCASYVTLEEVKDANATATTDCEKELESAGFLQSYWADLCALKEKYPNWKFEADKNGLDFATSVSKESVVGKSLIQTSNDGYLSLDTDSYDYLTDTFKVQEGSDWYAANSSVVAYYLDPRNFLDETYIFMFEKLSYDESYQTIDAVNAILSEKDIIEHAQVIVDAAKTYDVNAIYIASKIRQETGGNYTNSSLAGKSVTYNDVVYEHVYNPYNIGAYTGASDGLIWAVSGNSFLRPWLDLAVAIRGGASNIAATYISQGQDSIYFQKFNTSSYSAYSAYAHQYMTNIKGAVKEAAIAYGGYKSMDVLNSTNFTFVIPVYDNMQSEKYSLPSEGNPNNHLKEIKINDEAIIDFSHDKFEYTYYVPAGVNKLNVSASSISNKASISGNGEITLNSKETLLELIVTAENNEKAVYKINIIKTDGIDMQVSDIVKNAEIALNDSQMIFSAGMSVSALSSLINGISASAVVKVTNKDSGVLATSDEVIITNGADEEKYQVVIKGDSTGDGNINIQDLLRVQKYILGYLDLSGSYLKAADSNLDGVVDIVDLLRVQKHILGFLNIS